MNMALAESILERASTANESDCKWCRHPEKKVRAAGLCNHCYRIRSQIAGLEKKIERVRAQNINHPLGPVPPELDNDYKVALERAQCAKHEGTSRQRVAESVSGLDLEHLFSWVSQKFLTKDYFYGIANLLDWSFDDTQRRLLYHLLSRMQREYLREHRRGVAEAIVFHEDREKGLA